MFHVHDDSVPNSVDTDPPREKPKRLFNPRAIAETVVALCLGVILTTLVINYLK